MTGPRGAGERTRPAAPGLMSEDGEGDGLFGFGGKAVIVSGLHLSVGHKPAEMVHDLRILRSSARGDELAGIRIFDRFEDSN